MALDLLCHPFNHPAMLLTHTQAQSPETWIWDPGWGPRHPFFKGPKVIPKVLPGLKIPK